jgi:ferritin-like protein
MSKEIRLGANRTGLKASPQDSRALLESLDLQPEPPHPSIDATAIRQLYREQSDAVGSMPPPTDLQGAAGAAGEALMGQRLHILLDKLGERAAFERTGTRLYDAALTRLSDSPLPDGMSLDEVQEIRDEEHSHFLLLSEAIESLGGDPTAQTPCADFAGVQGMGLVQAMNDPRATLPQVLETLLAAELIDVASWEMLIELANGMKQSDLASRMETALTAENRHLERVRAWLSLAMEQSARLTGTE